MSLDLGRHIADPIIRYSLIIRWEMNNFIKIVILIKTWIAWF